MVKRRFYLYFSASEIPSNAQSPISVTSAGIVIDVSEAQCGFPTRLALLTRSRIYGIIF